MLLTSGMLVLVHALVETRWPEAIAGLALLAGFVAVETRAPQPLVRLGILRNAPLVRANLGAMALFGAYVGFQFVATLYLQKTLGWSALETALAFLPGGLLVAFGAPRMGAVISRYGTDEADPGLDRRLRGRLRAFLPVDATPYWLTFLPDDAARRPGLRARVRGAQRAGHGGRGRPRAGPRGRARADVLPDGRRDRARRW